MILDDLADLVAGYKTEDGALAAVVRELSALGYKRQPAVRKGVVPKHGTLRVYTWENTPLGDLALIAGPRVFAELHPLSALRNVVLDEDQTGVVTGDVKLTKGRRSVWERAKVAGTRKAKQAKGAEKQAKGGAPRTRGPSRDALRAALIAAMR